MPDQTRQTSKPKQDNSYKSKVTISTQSNRSFEPMMEGDDQEPLTLAKTPESAEAVRSILRSASNSRVSDPYQRAAELYGLSEDEVNELA